MPFSVPDDDLLGAPDGFFGEEPDPAHDLFGADVEVTPSVAGDKIYPDEPVPSVPASVPAREAKVQSSGYVVIARKYRPQTFDQLVGQDGVQQALRGAIANNQISHAYLFSGPRGTGKTSTARILAKAVNCQNNGPRPDPCGTCSSCRAVTVGSSLDVIEIDAASNTGVDNIRDLKSGVALAPFSRYKVYIVDEVHMLSNQAFNALLKTLEEPPANVIFVLATTELHKVPETILSRCQSFQFKRFSLVELKNQLGGIFDKEAAQRGIRVQPGEREKILEMIARSADGGMRDAQVTLDQVLVLSRGSLDLNAVQRFLGIPESDVLDSFLLQMQSKDTQSLLNRIDQLVADGQDLELFAKNLADYTRDLLLLKVSGGGTSLVNSSEDRLAQMGKVAQSVTVGFLVALGDSLLKLLEELKVSSQPRFALELAIIRLAMVDPARQLEDLSSRVDHLEKTGLSQGRDSNLPSTAQAAEPPAQDQSMPASAATKPVHLKRGAAQVGSGTDSDGVEIPAPDADLMPRPALQAEPSLSPQALLDRLQRVTLQKYQFLHAILCDSTRVKSIDRALVTLVVDDKFSYDLMSRSTAQNNLRELLAEVLGYNVAVRIDIEAPIQALSSIPDTSLAATLEPLTMVSKESGLGGQSVEHMAFQDSSQYVPPKIYISPEIRAKAVRDLSIEEVNNLLAADSQWRNLVEKARTVFKLDESSFRFQISTI